MVFGSGGAGAESAAQALGHRSDMACLIMAHIPRLASSKQLADPVAFKSCACRLVISDGAPGGDEAAARPAAAAAQPMMSTNAQSSWHGHSFGTVAWIADAPVMI